MAMQFARGAEEGRDHEGQQDPDQDCEELRVSSRCTLVSKTVTAKQQSQRQSSPARHDAINAFEAMFGDE
jgi:hypothetical protein